MTASDNKSKPGFFTWTFLFVGLVMIVAGAVVTSGVKNPQHALWRHSHVGSQGGLLGEMARQAAAEGDVNKGFAMLAVGWGAVGLGVLIAAICVFRLRRKPRLAGAEAGGDEEAEVQV